MVVQDHAGFMLDICFTRWFLAGREACSSQCDTTSAEPACATCSHILLARSYLNGYGRVDAPVVVSTSGAYAVLTSRATREPFDRDVRQHRIMIAGDSLTFECRTLSGPIWLNGRQMETLPADAEQNLMQWSRAFLADAGVDPLNASH
jgi:hypothetical protein